MVSDFEGFLIFRLELKGKRVLEVQRNAEAALLDSCGIVDLIKQYLHEIFQVLLPFVNPEHFMVYLHYGQVCSNLSNYLLVNLPLVLI